MFVYALLNMDDLTKHRKDRLRALIEGKPYAGNQAEFGRKAGLTKARITQLLNPDEPFGERAAESLCAKLELSPRWFEQGLATGEGEMQPAGTAQGSTLIEQGSGEISLTRALEVVASALQGADALSQMQARPLLQHLMEHPDQAGQIAPRLAALLGKLPVPAVETSDFAGQPPIALPFQKTKNSV